MLLLAAVALLVMTTVSGVLAALTVRLRREVLVLDDALGRIATLARPQRHLDDQIVATRQRRATRTGGAGPNP